MCKKLICFKFFFAMTLLISCSGTITQNNDEQSTDVSEIIPGAWQTHLYLPMLENKRIAFAGNHTSTIKHKHVVDSLLNAGINIIKVFSPEHGFRGTAAAGEHIKSSKDEITRLPIISLYGKNRRPTPLQLSDIDIILFDIQDVGVRFYTYISTMTYIMEEAAKLKIPLVILDRPNPNGHYIDGPILEPEYSSFVGLHPVPIVHGMTIGEYALMINQMEWLRDAVKCDLTIISIKNYTRDVIYEPPINPSPNLPNIKSVLLYPSLCFFEGTPISIGRGTDFPFQVFGHSQFPKKIFPFEFMPESRTEAPNPPELNKVCFGTDLRDTGIKDLKNEAAINLNYLIKAYNNYPDKENFFNNFFNLLAGNNKLQQQIISGFSEEEIRKSWKKGIEEFKEIRKKFLLYPDF